MASDTQTKQSDTDIVAQQYLATRLAQEALQKHVDEVPFEIPIIDLGPSFAFSDKNRQRVAEQIRTACLGSGFFFVQNHGISKEARLTLLEQAEKLFTSLSQPQKEAMHIRNSQYGLGWEDSAFTSIHGDVERKEAFNWGYQEDLDSQGTDGYVQLDGKRASDVNQWPPESDLPNFHEAVTQYYDAALQLARHMCKLFALSLHLPENYFDNMITHPSANARLMYYPPAADRATDSSDIGLGAHSDYQCFTILLCSSAPGLEILSPDGQWIEAPHVEDGLIVNIGDMMMRWTNGMYKSTVHRVVNRTNMSRYSVPLFFGTNNDAMIETLPSCVHPDQPSLYPPIRAGEYILQRLAATLTS